MAKYFLIAGIILAICGCAPATMTDNYWYSAINQQRAELSRPKKCCSIFSEIGFLELNNDSVDVNVSTYSEVMKINDEVAPVLGFKLLSKNAQYLEFLSLSDKTGGFGLRLDKILYIRPDVIFLGEDFREIEIIRSPNLCWGDKGMRTGAWSRFKIPKNAFYVVLFPSVKNPIQLIDTRRMALQTPEIARGISEARKSYHAEIRMGYTGLVSLELLSEDRSPLGQCR